MVKEIKISKVHRDRKVQINLVEYRWKKRKFGKRRIFKVLGERFHRVKFAISLNQYSHPLAPFRRIKEISRAVFKNLAIFPRPSNLRFWWLRRWPFYYSKRQNFRVIPFWLHRRKKFRFSNKLYKFDWIWGNFKIKDYCW